MKKVIFVLLLLNSIGNGQNHFNKGVNLSGWLQENNSNQIYFGKYTKQDFLNIKSLGCDVIRLPINLHFMTNGEPDYVIDPLFFEILDQIVTWAEEVNINLILDNHSFDPYNSTSPGVSNILIPVWKQMTEHYKNRSELIFYEILNEPNGISNTLWNAIQQLAIKEIRKIDSVHTIIVGATNWNTYNDLKNLPVYSDSNLIYTFHFYDPFIFTHQGANWTVPSMESLTNIPFPYSSDKMPTLPSEYNGTWIATNFYNYPNDGNIQKVKDLIDIAVEFKTQRNVEVFCGEFGVFMANANNSDRVEWYRIIREYFEENNIPWTTWDYQNGFGLFEKGSDELFNYDLNIPLITALGMNEAAQTNLVIKPDSANINIYSDYVENGMKILNYFSSGPINYYDENAASGKYCIHWTDANQYDFINFNFVPNKDFSYLVNSGANLYLSVKGNVPNSEFDLRFIDTKTDVPEDHPWRMRYKVKETNIIKWDNNWYKLTIPLKSFVEQGSWDGQWYNPIGKFDWSAIDNFDIVSEDGNLIDKDFWFDNMYIGWNTVDVASNEIIQNFQLFQNYPNPFNPTTKIKYQIPSVIARSEATWQSDEITSENSFARNDNVNVSLKVYDILGREIKTLVNEKQKPGIYEIEFDGKNLTSGVYFYKLSFGENITSKKMILIK